MFSRNPLKSGAPALAALAVLLTAAYKRNKISPIDLTMTNSLPFYINKANRFSTQIFLEGEGLLQLRVTSDHSDCELLVSEFTLQSEVHDSRSISVNAKKFSAKITPNERVLNVSFICCGVISGKFGFKIDLVFEATRQQMTVQLDMSDLELTVGCCEFELGCVPVDMTRQCVTRHVALHGGAQVGDLLAVNKLYLRQCIGCIGVAGWGDEAG